MKFNPSRRRGGFTIIEALVSTFITALAVTGLIAVLGNVSNVQGRIWQSERLERAADEKLNELIATGEILIDGSGTFDDEEESDLSWSSTYQETGTENLAHVQVTVTKGDDSVVADRLLFIPPEPAEDENETEGAPAQ